MAAGPRSRGATLDRKVAVLVFDRAPLFETSVPISVFGVDRSDTGAPRFDVFVVAAEPGPLSSTCGLGLDAPHDLGALGTCGIVIVPTWRELDSPVPQPVIDALRAAHARGATVVGLCLGAFVLAAAGLLDGRRAATHWRYAERLAAAYPLVRVDSSVLYADEGDILTSAGTAAGIDACLHLVRRGWGAEAANTIARRMVVSPQRAGGQAQFIAQPVAASEGHGLSDVMEAMLARLGENVDVDEFATLAGMSRRSFDRHFRDVTGSSPLQWLLHQRILHAQHLLETSDLGVDAVAHGVGFSSAISLRPHFRRTVGIPPQEYRRAFRVGKDVEPGVGIEPTTYRLQGGCSTD